MWAVHTSFLYEYTAISVVSTYRSCNGIFFLRNVVQVEVTPGYKIEDHLGCSTSKSKSRLKMTKRFLEKQLSVIRAGNLIGIFPISHENDTLTVDGKSWQGIYRFVLAAFSAFSMTGKVICCPWYFI